MIVPVILSGGEGRRLWPLSSPDRPKQFLALIGDETLLQQTTRRLSDPALFAPPIIIGGAGQRFLIAEQLLEAGLTVGRIVLEPSGRNTAPALAIGALLAASAEPDALILSAHADHAIPDVEAFRETIERGVPAAEAGKLVLFGMKPTYPATAYGYIEPGAPIDSAARAVKRFVEKPDAVAAEALATAGCLWNSGLFLMRAGALIAELETHAPAVLAAASAAIEQAQADADFLRLDAEAFGMAPSISIDHAVMELTANAAVVAADFAWSDIGSWSSVWEAQNRDEAGNASRGAVVLESVTDCLIFTEGPKVAAFGVADLIIVATHERVLVLPRLADQRVRDLAERADRL
ncbi:MAG TPA: mannose-1-phosphate guanylyltransferase/mannose-6-phosphate isomerase [Caulobacteraceae bacterium]|nr:mannose-1-phosphate guanylyltransferase/mannose-6-phosphate isomerase [Caulobacteraceae bacterium]